MSTYPVVPYKANKALEYEIIYIGDKTDVQGAMNALGADGWEFIAVGPEAKYMIFMRALQATPEPAPPPADPASLATITDEGVITYTGFDEAYIGAAERAGMATVTAYARTEMVRILMERDGMTEEGADEYIDYNIVQGYLGEQTPIIVDGRILLKEK